MAISGTPPDTGLTLAGYQLHLPDFEGPLDVLLRLVERSQLEITDVSLVAVLDQFLAYVDAMHGAPPAVIAEFTTVGTRLTLLKSRSLLPRPPLVDEEEDPGDLTAQLIAYKQLKVAAARLGDRHAAGVVSFPMHTPLANGLARQAPPPRLAQYEPVSLWRSLRRRIAQAPRPTEVVAQVPVLTIREAMGRLGSLLGRTRAATFRQFVAPYRSRAEVATAFLATLVMMRRRQIEAEQHGLFGEIELRPIDGAAVPSDADTILEFEPAP